MTRALVIIPTYQEAASLGRTLAALRAASNADVLVVDDNSPDGTADLAESLGVTLGGVYVMRRPAKAGLGSAYRAGFAWGLERHYDVLVEMDADLSHDPAMVPSLIEAAAHADLAIGSRYVAGGSTPDWPWRRRQLSRWANRYASFMLQLPVRDVTAGFRAYRAELVERLQLERVQADGYAFQIEMVDFARHVGARIVELPICFRDREHGQSKMSSRVITEAMTLVTLWGIQRRIPFRNR